MMRHWMFALAVLAGGVASADDEVINYLAYDETFASGGGVTEAALKRLQTNGLERVIYLAYSDQKQSLAREDRIVDELGMDYIHIPVRWDAPSPSHFNLFAAIMQQAAVSVLSQANTQPQIALSLLQQ